jgi:Fe-S cluster assembly protein SufD
LHSTVFAPALVLPERRDSLLARAAALSSGREKPGRYWRIDIDAIDLTARTPAPYAAPQIDAPAIRGGFAGDLEAALKDYRSLIDRVFGSAIPLEDRKYAALSAALCNGGAFVYVPAGVAVDEPIQITYDAPEAPFFPYTLVLAERGARATIIERFRGQAGAALCSATEILSGEGATVTYAAEQILPEDARIFFTRAACPGKDSSLSFALAELGAGLSVGSADVRIAAPGASATIAALFFPQREQHLDLISTVSHDAGASQSQTLVKSAAAGRGQARFLGNIRIAPHAQETDAKLRDDALLLSEGAHIDSVPALEIAANQVRAYHGATVGALDAEQIFYMTSRGLPRDQAERMIALGFFEPAVEHFPTNALRERIREALEAKVAS